MTTVMYPLTRLKEYTELRYSLRSIAKYLKPQFKVVIVTDHLPDWITNVIQIELPDIPNKKQLSIKAKIMAALEYSEEVFFMNDDVFLLQPTNPKKHPYYFKGSLKGYSESGAKPLYNQLMALNKPVNNFDGHFPLIYNQAFKEAVSSFTEDTLIKSAYCNYLGIEGIEMQDCKIVRDTKPEQVRAFIKDRPCFSTGIYSLKCCLPILEELFPVPSKFEII